MSWAIIDLIARLVWYYVWVWSLSKTVIARIIKPIIKLMTEMASEIAKFRIIFSSFNWDLDIKYTKQKEPTKISKLVK